MALLAVSFAGACSLVGGPSGGVAPPGSTEALPGRVADPSGADAGVGLSDTLDAPEALHPPIAPFTGPRSFPEVRGLWVTRGTMTSAAEVRSMVSQAHDAGFNTLLVQVRGRADAFYRSSLEPRGPTIVDGADFDPLALAIEEAHGRGMAVHAWVNTHLVWGAGPLPEDSTHMVLSHPEWLGVPRELGRRLYAMDPGSPAYVQALHEFAVANKDRVEGIFSSPSHPEVQALVHSIWMDLARRYDLDGIHFDYIRYPNHQFDYSRSALLSFRDWAASAVPEDRRRELDEALRSDPYAWAGALPDEWGDFRRLQITDLVARIYRDVKALRPELVVSAAVFPDVDDAYRYRFQEWREWLAAGIVDAVVPMAYTPDRDRYAAQIGTATGAAAGGHGTVWAGVGAYLNGVDGTLEKIAIARRSGARGIVLFSYDWAVTDGSPKGTRLFLEQVSTGAFGR